MTEVAIDRLQPSELEAVDRDRDEQGFGALSTERGRLPMEALDVRARLVGLVAEIEVAQTFVNALDQAIEATYIFPLPDRAAVHSFHLQVAGRVVDGVIQERGQARQQYDEAIAAGHRAAITEEERSGVFTMRVGNLPPGERATVRLRLVGPLPQIDGEVSFRFPLVVAPRYIPGIPLEGRSVGAGTAPDTDAVPDASRITPPVLLPGYPNPVRLALAVEVDPAGLPLGALRSSLHAVAERRDGERLHVELRPGERLDRDFVLRYRLGDDQVRAGLALAPDADGAEGTFLLTLVPPVDAASAPRPRDVVFVLDRSGSMSGWKMVAARRAVARMIDTLTARDRFAVLAFDDRIDHPPELGDGLVDATDRNRFRAVEFLAGLDGRGGTEMARPLERAAAGLAGGYQERDRVLVLATDGQVGNEDQILRRLSTELRNVRVFTLGIDQAVNAGFLRRLAALGGGACELVESEDRLDDVMDRIHRRIGAPVVTEVAVAAEGLEIEPDSLAPARCPDLFAGAPVIIAGRYRGASTGAVVVSGVDAGGAPWRQVVEGRRAADARLAPMWARAIVRELEDRYAVGRGAREELERRIVSISLRHSVLCRFTAFVAIDRAEKVALGGAPQSVVQPVELPRGWAAGAVPGAPPPMAAMACPAPMDFDAMAPPTPAPSQRPSSPARSRSRVGAALGAPLSALRRLGGGGGASSEEAEAAPFSVDLEPYLERLRVLVAELEAASMAVADRLRRLGRELGLLVEDLRSVGAPAPLLARLEQIHRRLAGAPAGDPSRALEEALAELRAVTEGHRGSAPRRREFWR